MTRRSLFHGVLWVAILVVSLTTGIDLRAQDGTSGREWSVHGGDGGYTRYAPLDQQITERNVADLEVAWRRPAVAAELHERWPDLQYSNQRSTPIIVDGVLYASNGIGLVEAFDPGTGETIWVQELPESGNATLRGTARDQDFPAAPNLVDITVDGRPIKAVAQVSKQAFTYVFDRETGEPVWPIEERPVPPSDIPGERLSPTQPFPIRPPPFDQQGVSISDLIDFTPELRREALEIIRAYRQPDVHVPETLRSDRPTAASDGAGTDRRSRPGARGGHADCASDTVASLQALREES